MAQHRTKEEWLDAAYGIKRLKGMLSFARSEDWSRRMPEFREYINKRNTIIYGPISSY